MRRFVNVSGLGLAAVSFVMGCSNGEERGPAPAPVEDPAAELAAVRDNAMEDDLRGLPTISIGKLASLHGEMNNENVLAYVKRIGNAWELRGASETLGLRGIQRDASGASHARIDERIHGRRVIGGELIIHADARGDVFMVNGQLVPESARANAEQPKLDAAAALGVAMASLEAVSSSLLGSAELVYVVDGDDALRLAWAEEVRWQDDAGERHHEEIFADATDGVLLTRHPKTHSALYREVFDAKGAFEGPPAGIPQGTLLFREGGRSEDAIAMAAYENVGRAWEFYATKLDRDGIDGRGGKTQVTVHLGQSFDNALYTGIVGGNFLAFGDGSGTRFAPLAKSLDIVAHEYTHAVTNHTAALVYLNDAGAINEAMSDIMGAATEAHALGGVSNKTWMLGEDVFTPTIEGDALRYLDSPTKDGVSCDWYPECAKPPVVDNGGVHTRSGVANLAFKLLVTGGVHPRHKAARGARPVMVDGVGLDDATKIFYTALTSYMTSSADYFQARVATVEAAKRLFGEDSRQATSTRAAWDAVGAPRSGSVARQNGTTTLSSAKGKKWVKYKITVPHANFNVPQWLEIFAWPAADSDAKDNADIYVGSDGEPPTTERYTKKSTLGLYEYMRFENVEPGDHYIWLYAPKAKGFTGVNLRATYGFDLGTEPAEPNDTVSASFPTLPLQGGLVANESARGVTGTIDRAGDVDHFAITIPAGKLLGVDLRVPPGKDYDLTIKDATTGEELAKSALRVRGGSEHLNVRNASTRPVPVIVTVSGANDESSPTAAYHLAANLLH